jgi:hypothetical protein
MGQGKSAHAHSVKITIDNAIIPNGFFPPEIIYALMNLVESRTYRSLASSCKLWYETGKTATYGSRIQLLHNNMSKGLWWQETLAIGRPINYAEVRCS